MSLKDVRSTFNEVITEVCDHHNSIILQKGGKAVAALIDIELFEKLQQLKIPVGKIKNSIMINSETQLLN